jgi:hypothetical protein
MSASFERLQNAEQLECARSEYEHERAARVWATAKAELLATQARCDQIALQLSAARAAEEDAWNTLHEASGRIPPRDKVPQGQQPPNVGGLLHGARR